MQAISKLSCGVSVLLAVMILIFSANNAVGQDGTFVNEGGLTVGDLTIAEGGGLYNEGVIEANAVNVFGWLSNYNFGTIRTTTAVNVFDGGWAYNQNNAYINTANVNNGATWSFGGFGSGGLYNSGNATIGMANVNFGSLYNYDNATIGTVSVTDLGFIQNFGNARIGTASAIDFGLIENFGDAEIGMVTVDGGGWFDNYGNAVIGTANIYGNPPWGGEVSVSMQNYNRDNAAIGTANVYNNGWLINYDNATIESATVNSGGRLGNSDNARIGTANVNSGGRLYNSGNATIGTANVDAFGYLYNLDNATIKTANVYAGDLENSGFGTIGTANICGHIYDEEDVKGVKAGLLYNRDNATIETANVYAFGWLRNLDNAAVGTVNLNNSGSLSNSATVGTVNVNGGNLHNYATIGMANVYDGSVNNGDGYDSGTGYIETANIYGGTLYSSFNGKSEITTANVNGGYLYNGLIVGTTGIITEANVNGGYLFNGAPGATGYIVTANVSGGYLQNRDTTNGTVNTIGTMNFSGGTVENGSRINEMIYINGSYSGTWTSGYGTPWEQTYFGSIGTLTLAGNAANNPGDWGKVENLQFASNGAGILTIAAFADGGTPGFSGIKASNVDFADGNVSLDLSGVAGISDGYWASVFFDAFGYDDGFYLQDLAGATTFGGIEDLYSFGVAWGDDPFWILNDGVFWTGWSIDAVTGFVLWDGTMGGFDGGNGSVPEPATLVILGLGLAGLALARRRR